ncbi:MAG: hypothetical protein JWM20_247 [Patescibacteria group bacterium]|nr:hypothetical protein [Patescibacteria group bacterium]
MATAQKAGFKKIILNGDSIIEVPADYKELQFIKTFKLSGTLSQGVPGEVIKVAGFDQLVSTDKPEPGKRYAAEFFKTEKDFSKAEVIEFMKSRNALSFGFSGLFFAYKMSPKNLSGARIWGINVPLISLDFNNSYKGGREFVLGDQDEYVELVGLVYQDEGYLRFETIEKRHYPQEITKGSIISIFKPVE